MRTSSDFRSAPVTTTGKLCPLPDFAALPPEVNSGRMYSGPGSMSLMAAAAAWDRLAEDLQSAATAIGSAVADLTDLWWRGPAADSMAASARPYVSWLSATATLAEQTAMQSRAVAEAYELAFALTVPPSVVAANRTLLMTLIATNWLGQNTPAIATAEFDYAEMWLQDAVAMTGYAGSATAASTLKPFTSSPDTINSLGLADQALATANATAITAGNSATAVSATAEYLVVAAAVMSLLQRPAALAGFPWNTLLKYWTAFLDAMATTEAFVYDAGGFTLMDLQVFGIMLRAGSATSVVAADDLAGPAAAAAWSSLSQIGGGPAAAAVGLADWIGPLSVPPSWAATASPGAQTGGLSTPAVRTAATRAAEMSGALQGLSPRRTAEAGGNFGRRYGSRIRVVCRPLSGG
ncbi:PPE family protein [Mycobacterium sp. ML4]